MTLDKRKPDRMFGGIARLEKLEVRFRGKKVDTVRKDKAFEDFCRKEEQGIGLKLEGNVESWEDDF